MDDLRRGINSFDERLRLVTLPLIDQRWREPIRLLLSIFLVTVFYFPVLLSSAHQFAYLYTGDITGFYVPTIMKTHALVRGLHFTALDYAIYNGSSDFFLSPNFFTFHPLILLYSAIAPLKFDTTVHLGLLLTVMMVLHSVAALYFTQRLFQRFLGVDFAAALFGGVLFIFCIHMVHALGQPPFFFVATVFPWAICSVLETIERPDPLRTLLASIPVVLTLVGGYIPLGLASIEFLTVTAIIYLIYTQVARKLAPSALLIRALNGALPIAIGLAACLLYVLALYLFSKETNSDSTPNLLYSAHQMSEAPSGLLRAVSDYWSVPGPLSEFTVSIGLAPLTIIAIFIFSGRAINALKKHELFALAACAAAYVISVLAIYGPYSVTSDLIYYFDPQVGKMHIYQRFLVFSQLALSAVVTLMLTAVARTRPSLTIRSVFAVMCLLTGLAAFVLAYHSDLYAKLFVQPAIIIELLSAAVVAAVMLTPSRTFIYVTAAALAVMPPMSRLYQSANNPAMFAQQLDRIPLYLNPGYAKAVANYMRQHSKKAYIKYADITPMWTDLGIESFEKVFPYFVDNQSKISSYSGFTFYLSSRSEYRARMPIGADVRLQPDWAFLKQSGADFLVAQQADVARSAPLRSLISKAMPDDIYHAPGNVIIAPLDDVYPGAQPPIFDNGMIRLSAEEAPGSFQNLAKGAQARASTAATPAALAVDGNVDGDFTHGSVAHTGKDLNAWIQVDLGSSRKIGTVRIWNRTDCCSYRLNRAWVFVSDTPFGDADKAADLKTRPGVTAHQILASQRVDVDVGGVTGRYVRVQLPGDEPIGDAFLHIAELQVLPFLSPQAASLLPRGRVEAFQSNFANHITATLSVSAPTKLEYLFSDNPRLVYKVDGRRVKFDTSNGVPTYKLSPGRHRLDIRYHHPLLALFWIIYAIYWALIIAVGLLMVSGRAAKVRARLRTFPLYAGPHSTVG